MTIPEIPNFHWPLRLMPSTVKLPNNSRVAARLRLPAVMAIINLHRHRHPHLAIIQVSLGRNKLSTNVGTPSGAYGVIGGGKPKASPATGSNAVSSHYAGYEAAVYAAANNYIQGKGTAGGGGGWQQQKNSPNRGFPVELIHS